MVVPWYLGTTNTLASRWCHNLATRHPRLDKPKATVKSMSYLPMLCLTSFCSLMLCVYRAKDGQTRQKFLKSKLWFISTFRLANQIQNNQSTDQRNLESKRIGFRMAHGGYPSPVSGSVRAKILELHQATSQAAGHDHWKLSFYWCENGVTLVLDVEKRTMKNYIHILYILLYSLIFICTYMIYVCIVYCIYIPYVFLCKYRNVMGTYCIAHYSYSIMTHEHACALHLDCW